MTKKKGIEKHPAVILPRAADLDTFLKRSEELVDFTLADIIQKFLNAVNINGQLQALNKVTVWLRQNNETADPRLILVIDILLNLYVKVDSKHPLKRALTCSLQTCSSHLHTRDSLQKDILLLSSSVDVGDGQARKTFVDQISSLMENFQLGEEIVVSIPAEIMLKMVEILNAILKELWIVSETSDKGSVDQSTTMHDFLFVLRVFNKYLQKSSAYNNFNDEKDPISQSVVSSLTNIVGNLIATVADETFLLDCRVASGMAVPLIVKILFKDHAIHKIANHLFPNVPSSAMSSKINYPVVDLDGLRKVRGNICASICILNGVLAMLGPVDLVFTCEPGKIFMTDVVGEYYLNAIPRATDANSKLVLSRGLILLTAKAGSALKISSPEGNSTIAAKLIGGSTFSEKLISYSWNHWEDPIDVVRHQARTVFENTIKCHALASNEDYAESDFVKNLIRTLLEMSWGVKGKYGPLCGLLAYVKSSFILDECPNLHTDMLQYIGEQSLTNYLSEFYIMLSKKHLKELQEKDDIPDAQEVWFEFNLKPVVMKLCRGSKPEKSYCMEYLVPGLLKFCPQALRYVISQLGSTGECDSDRLWAQIICLKHAKLQGLLKVISCDSSTDDTWNNVISVALLKQALCHRNDQIRLDAFGLICENHKTTESLGHADFCLIKYFLTYNLSNQEPPFRQQLTAVMKKLFVRVRDSGRANVRKHYDALKKGKVDESETALAYVAEVKDLLTWTMSLLFECLYPGAGFPTRTTALSFLALVFEILKKEDSAELEFDLMDEVNHNSVQSVLECLRDTFESNKSVALNILCAIPTERLFFKAEETTKLFSVALDLASSTRPQDSVTAAYLLKFLVTIPTSYQTILVKLSELGHDAERINSTNEESTGHISLQNTRLCVKLLIVNLEQQLVTAKRSLLHTAATKPMYPIMLCIRYLLNDVNLRKVKNKPLWRSLIQELLSVSLEIAEVVSPGVNNSSPEGNIPTDSVIGPGLSMEGVVSRSDDLDLLKESATKVTLMPEYLVVCCWRCIKEVSLLMGQLSSNTPIIDSRKPTSDGILSVEELEIIGKYFNTQLLESRHRGAFELAYAGFVQMVSMLWKSTIQEIYRLPNVWLDDIMTDIKSRDPNSKLCSTRRSAGVPYFIQALVSTSNSAAGKQCFRRVMAELLCLAEAPEVEGENEDTGRIHSLNILRALYKDTRLGDDVFPYISDGITISILGYGSKFWAIRNCSTLLFSALMNRIFGAKKGKDEQAKKNCLSGRVFFNRFPKLYTFLLNQLTEATSFIGSSGVYKLHPGLYPILMILGRLYPSVVEGADPSVTISAFIPHLIKCASTPVYKTRMMAARALLPLVSADHVYDILEALISNSQYAEPSAELSNNLIHGTSTQMLFIVKSLPDLPVVTQNKVASILIPAVHVRYSDKRICYSNKTVMSKMILELIRHEWKEVSDSQTENLNNLRSSFYMQGVELLAANIGATWAPGLTEYLQTLTECLLSTCRPADINLLIKILDSGTYEVRLVGLLHICDLIETLPRKSKAELSESLIPTLMSMLIKEEHPECLEMVLKGFSGLNPGIQSYRNDTAGKMLKKLEELFHHPRDEVRCEALIAFSGLLPNINQHAYDDDVRVKEVMHVWLEMVIEMSSIESTVDSRLACAKSLTLTSFLITENSQLLTVDGCLRLWTSLFHLLQDDDTEVRELAADVIHSMWHSENYDSEKRSLSEVMPEKALEMAVEQFIKLQCIRSGDCTTCVKQLINWTLETSGKDASEDDVRLFDRGELNTYKDDSNFMTVLLKVAGTTDWIQMTPEALEEIRGETDRFLTDAGVFVDACSKKVVSSESPFDPNTQQKYDNMVLDLVCRMTAARLVILILKSSSEQRVSDFEKRAQSLTDRIVSIFSIMPSNYLLTRTLFSMN